MGQVALRLCEGRSRILDGDGPLCLAGSSIFPLLCLPWASWDDGGQGAFAYLGPEFLCVRFEITGPEIQDKLPFLKKDNGTAIAEDDLLYPDLEPAFVVPWQQPGKPEEQLCPKPRAAGTEGPLQHKAVTRL
ncbi:hypothetical protein AAES_76488 [Amazona aestiva]|uniref:Uncharacterized protein n=1 Tax=Amazona aestiva TaxID=12930 RepID=A0A0Q3R9V9_AMAAE|nr:hypothetical protein AAES_76488 [Amazona aestiva]